MRILPASIAFNIILAIIPLLTIVVLIASYFDISIDMVTKLISEFMPNQVSEVIKKAASILINNQQEHTDIVRTDGNEFLIYMVGFDEKSVIDYTRKISKELKELPHGFGATLGYSMIEDDIKTIDDAINEATLSMRQAKEKL